MASNAVLNTINVYISVIRRGYRPRVELKHALPKVSPKRQPRCKFWLVNTIWMRANSRFAKAVLGFGSALSFIFAYFVVRFTLVSIVVGFGMISTSFRLVRIVKFSILNKSQLLIMILNLGITLYSLMWSFNACSVRNRAKHVHSSSW